MASVDKLIDREAEQAVLGALLLGCEVGVVADLRKLLTTSSFGAPGHGAVWDALLAVLDRGGVPDIIAVRNELERVGRLQDVGGVEAIAGLVDTIPTTANALFHAKIVRDYTQRRSLSLAGHQAIRLASTKDVPVDEAYAQTLQGLIASQSAERGERVSRVGVGLVDAAERLIARNEGGLEPGASLTGLKALDEMFGGVSRGCVTLIAANASCGKTQLALAIGRHIADTRTVYHASLEMTKDKLIGRLLCAEAGVMQGARYYSDYDIQKMAEAGKHLNPLPYFLDTSPVTPQQVRMEVQALQAEGHDPVVIIDYLQLLRWPNAKDRENKNVEVGHISRFLKRDVAMALNVPVIALSQLSRKNIEGGKKRPPVESDLRDSGSLEQDADHILMLHYEGAEDGRSHIPGWESPQLTECYVRKNRDGNKGQVKLWYDRPTGRWADWK